MAGTQFQIYVSETVHIVASEFAEALPDAIFQHVVEHISLLLVSLEVEQMLA